MSKNITTLVFEDPLQIKATISFTMSIGDWIKVHEALCGPAWSVPTRNMEGAIADAIDRAQVKLGMRDASPPPSSDDA